MKPEGVGPQGTPTPATPTAVWDRTRAGGAPGVEGTVATGTGMPP